MSFESIVREAWPDKADEILAIVRGEKDPMEYSDVERWVRSCYHEPSKSEQKMCALNQILEGYGCEAIFGSDAKWPDMEYVNMGDSYNLTIVRDYLRDKYRAMSWGDWVEEAERAGRIYE